MMKKSLLILTLAMSSEIYAAQICAKSANSFEATECLDKEVKRLRTELNTIYKKVYKQTEAKKELRDWLLLANQLSIPEFQHCITTFTNWSTEIANIVGENISNGFIEGSNNKIKVLKRISFGFQNFRRLRNRILSLI